MSTNHRALWSDLFWLPKTAHAWTCLGGVRNMPRMCQMVWEACLEYHSLGMLVECQSSNQLCSIFRLWKNPQWHTCLEMPGGHRKPTCGMSESLPGMVVLQPIMVSILSSPHGKHAWNARDVSNMSGMLVHGWVSTAWSRVKCQRSEVKGEKSRANVKGQRWKLKGQRSWLKGQGSNVKGQIQRSHVKGHGS